jgi:outer membrane protein assembly factor BamB
VAIIVLQWLGILVPGWVAPLTFAHFMGWFLTPMVAAVGVALWWLIASRLPWTDRLLGLLAFAAGCAAVVFLGHPTIGVFGLIVYALALMTTAWVVWLVATPFLNWPVRRVGLVMVLLLVAGCFVLVRNEGTTGSMAATFQFRWTPTAEDRMLAELHAGKLRSASPAGASAAEPVVLAPGDWPGFRGPERDGRLTGVRLAADWNQHPPRQVWRHRVGPGWSSFAAVGTRLYTQEQRGEDEAVVCYDAGSGEELWSHTDVTRFTETLGGPGPRATPTFHDGKVYALGAKGRLNCLDAATGKVVWSKDIAAESGASLPVWGFAASPLVSDNVVVVFAGGPDKKSVLAYDAASGKPAWSSGAGLMSYSSPHPARLGGVEQLLMMTDRGLTAFEPASGKVLWQHDWPLQGMARIVQPTVLDDSNVLMGTGNGMGTRQLHVHRDGDAWKVEEVRTIRALKPYFNDHVVYQGHLYGFDANFFTCVNLEDGKGKWRVRDYGSGQVLLLADQGLLLVLSETGEAALVEATPEAHRERCRFQALEGKTWNHPVVAHGKLFVRNGEEAACYELTPEGVAAAAK